MYVHCDLQVHMLIHNVPTKYQLHAYILCNGINADDTYVVIRIRTCNTYVAPMQYCISHELVKHK